MGRVVALHCTGLSHVKTKFKWVLSLFPHVWSRPHYLESLSEVTRRRARSGCLNGPARDFLESAGASILEDDALGDEKSGDCPAARHGAVSPGVRWGLGQTQGLVQTWRLRYDPSTQERNVGRYIPTTCVEGGGSHSEGGHCYGRKRCSEAGGAG